MLRPVELVKQLVLPDDVLEAEVLALGRVPVVYHLPVLVILNVA